MPQVLPKAEGMNQRLHGAAAHARCDFARKQPCRGPGEKQLNLLRIQETARESLPSGHILDLVQEEDGALPVPPFRLQSVILLYQQVKIGTRHAGQALVFEAEIKKPLAGHSTGQPIRQHLPKKGGLPGAPHADNRYGLAPHAGQPHVPARE